MKLIITPFDQSFDRQQFSCGENLLDDYLKKYARQDIKRNISRIFVSSTPDCPKRVIGFYSLSANSLDPELLPNNLRKKLPKFPLPVSLLGRLAIDKKFKSQGVGKMLLVDSMKRVYYASQSLAVYALIVEAINEDAKKYYEKFGFIPLPDQPFKLFLPLSTIESLINSSISR
ncbi:MAG: GNAT family N-acetyltransferase [Gammaproteobacteria bacterium]|nr:GNAT family N-acetyltransferase [Gammaproteobacteria bacterium]